jgi:CHAT domain-containing protein
VLLVGDPAPLPAIAGTTLAALPGARVEVRDIAAALPKESAAALIGADATESRVRSMTSGRHALHFATHGIVFNERPFDSFLALAPDRNGNDGRLTTSDIYGMKLSADLVVLSACRTATGQLSGDGVQGLARAFFYAGTPSVIATLWDLPDGPARHLFPEFYRAWTGGADRSAALRTAQLSLIRALRRGTIAVDTPLGSVKVPEHPAVWAAPVLLGQP